MALRAAVLVILLLPLLMLPAVLRWSYGSWHPCAWLQAQAEAELRELSRDPTMPASQQAERRRRAAELLSEERSIRQCALRWLDLIID